MHHLLPEGNRRSSGQLFGPATAALARAIQLASVSTLCRCAAVLAVSALPEHKMRPSRNLEPVYLSALLAQLVAGRQSLRLACPLLTSPRVPSFLERARPSELVACGPAHFAHEPVQENAAVGQVLVRCTSVLRLECDHGLLPSALPPKLQALSLSLQLLGASADASSLLQALPALPDLAELKLEYTSCEHVPEHLPHLTALRQLSVTIMPSPGQLPCSLRALREVAERGASVSLAVHMLCEDDIDIRWLQASDQERLWAAVAQVPSLSQLHISDASYGAQTEVEDRERQLLQSVTCHELLLQGGVWDLDLVFAGQLLLSVCAQTFLWRCESSRMQLAVPWAWLTAQPGVVIFDMSEGARLTISGSPGCLPIFDAP